MTRVLVVDLLAGAPRSAPSGAGLWSSPGGLPCLSPRLEPAGRLLGLLEIFLAGVPGLLGTALEMPFDFAVGLRLASTPCALIVHGTCGGMLRQCEANVRRQRWHTVLLWF
jgi:hypothetical protein